MAWIKVPIEHHPIFRAALPSDPRVETRLMFGGIAAKVNGHLFAGLFARSAIVNLDEASRAEALALDGASYFDPMGNGRVIGRYVLLPEDVLHDPRDLRDWLSRAFAYTTSLPPKKARPAAAAKKAVAKKAVAKKPIAKKAVAKKPIAKKAVAEKPIAKKPIAKKPIAKKPVAKSRAR
jgi:TfoX/Sxy family transcriptional regulator of competence genes